MSKFHLEIVTPEKSFYEGDIKMVIVRGLEGDLAVLKGKSPIATPLKIGKVRIFEDEKERVAAVVDGYITVVEDKVTIVTDAAEWPDEIDVERAKAAKERAEKTLRDKQGADVDRAEYALKRALNRLDVANLKKFD